jgi:queuine/archaeosine tRNA-ribosyltransferase
MRQKAPYRQKGELLVGRATYIPISGTSLAMPCFFPSISCVKANLNIVEYLRTVKAVGYPLFLISAYDVYNCSSRNSAIISGILKESIQNGKAVVLDSGNYESYWVRDADWTRDKYWACLSSCDYGFAFHFDKRLQKMKRGTVESITNEIERSVLSDQRRAPKGTVIPIIHASSELLPEIAARVAVRLNPVMIAMPERELGDGIIARSVTIARIRKSLNQLGQYYPVHLLGTGNPLSILIYVMSGADSFDGLEWCQTTVNYDNALLYHFQQRELFGQQSKYDSLNIPYTQATLAHNLEFYRIWMQKIQELLIPGRILDMAENYIPKEFLRTLKDSLAKA